MRLLIFASILFLACGCTSHRKPVQPVLSVAKNPPRRGDEIVVCGKRYHTGAPVVLWTDPGGYDGYRPGRGSAPVEDAGSSDAAHTYGIRFNPVIAPPAAFGESSPFPEPARPSEGGAKLTRAEFERIRAGGWPLELLRQKVDQFVFHYDVSGTSRRCFRTLQDERGLSVHFMLDLDGTIYQTLDLQERAWHASDSNSRSIGIEIANVGAFRADDRAVLDATYQKDEQGRTRLVLPPDAGLRTPAFVPRPARDEAVTGNVQSADYVMYDLTPEQYESLIKLTATVCRLLPRITPDYPRDDRGELITRVLDDARWESFHGLLGHYHVQQNKQDPGPAFQWDKVTNGVRALMRKPALPPGDTINARRAPVAVD
jgi:N-acetylmuramoyl-L-alanine amidase